MLQHKIPVKLAVEIQSTFHEEDRNTHNVIAEIEGSDNALKDEIVMVGAHLDSWHTATGATDNADGSATVMEAMRILKALNVRPRRTIRAALWGGRGAGSARLEGLRAAASRRRQEQGRARQVLRLFQPRQWLPADQRLLHGRQTSAARAIMSDWLKPVANIGAIMPAPGHIGATDHPHSSRSACPASRRCRITSATMCAPITPTWTPASESRPNALKQAATVMAVVLYQAAMREGTFPKPAPPKVATRQ
ncbi:MAG: M28 family peptidase [Hymenobacter sp.]